MPLEERLRAYFTSILRDGSPDSSRALLLSPCSLLPVWREAFLARVVRSSSPQSDFFETVVGLENMMLFYSYLELCLMVLDRHARQHLLSE